MLMRPFSLTFLLLHHTRAAPASPLALRYPSSPFSPTVRAAYY